MNDEVAEERLEQDLRQLGHSAALPWLRLRVETALASRESARKWLAQHPPGVLGLSGLSLGPQDWRRNTAQLIAICIGAGVGWGAAVLLTGAAPPGQMLAQLPLMAAGLCGVAVFAATRWPELRGYFTA